MDTYNGVNQVFDNTIYNQLLIATIVGVLIVSIGLITVDPVLIIYILIVCIAIVLAFMTPVKYFVYVLALYMPFEPFVLKWLPANSYIFARYGIEVSLVIALMPIIIKKRGKSLRLYEPLIDLPIAFILIAAVISVMASDFSITYYILGFRSLFRFILIYLLVINAKLIRKDIIVLMVSLLIIGFIEALIGLAQSIIGSAASEFLQPIGQNISIGNTSLYVGALTQFQSGKLFIFGTLARYNIYGIFLCLLMILSIGMIYEYPRFRKYLFFFVLALDISMLLSTSRIAMLGLIIGATSIVMVVKDRKAMIAVVLTLIVISVSAAIFWSTLANLPRPRVGEDMTFNDRLLHAIHPSNLKPTPNSNFRLYLMSRVGKQIMQEHPITGLGIGSFGSAYSVANQDSFYQRMGISRNWVNMVSDVEYLTIFAQTGLLGLSGFLLLIVSTIIQAIKCRNNSSDNFVRGLALGIVGCMSAIVIFNYAYPFLETRTLSFYFWLLLGISAVLGQKQLSNKRDSRFAN